MRGKLVALEGIDGSGKSSVLAHVADALASRGIEVHVTREETDTWLGEAVRRSIAERADPLATAFLFLADRAAHVPRMHQELAAGRHVLCDRFLHSTLAYQSVTLADRIEDAMGFLRGLHAPLGLTADHVLLLDVPGSLAVERVSRRGSTTEYERADFLEKVRRRYLDLANQDPSIRVLDASRPLVEVCHEAEEVVGGWLR